MKNKNVVGCLILAIALIAGAIYGYNCYQIYEAEVYAKNNLNEQLIQNGYYDYLNSDKEKALISKIREESGMSDAHAMNFLADNIKHGVRKDTFGLVPAEAKMYVESVKRDEDAKKYGGY